MDVKAAEQNNSMSDSLSQKCKMQKKKAEAEKAKSIIFKLEKNWTHQFLFFCYPSRIKILSAHCFNHINMFNAIQGKPEI